MVQYHGQRWGSKRTSVLRHLAPCGASVPHPSSSPPSTLFVGLSFPGPAQPAQWGCGHSRKSPSVKVVRHIPHVLAHLIPVLTIMPILQRQKQRFRAGSDRPRVPQLGKRRARGHVNHIGIPPHMSSLQALEEDGGTLAGSRYQLTYHSRLTLGNTGATQNYMTCPYHPQPATAWPGIGSRGGAGGSDTAPFAHSQERPSYYNSHLFIILVNDY